ncbi:hypothetical protein DPMN_013946 [Dreissena polymorpha]|uniref:Uncharacterized protein n=1 Tax=Dreissena polymorpha TaxID=45954 RepID=A0A9D4N9X1_DREPO|nr:hypothetical protein DPMN_013946 [Dreissena polymorpha]
MCPSVFSINITVAITQAFTRVTTPVEVAPPFETTGALTTQVEVAPISDVGDDEWMAAQATTFIELMTTQEAMATTTVENYWIRGRLEKRSSIWYGGRVLQNQHGKIRKTSSTNAYRVLKKFKNKNKKSVKLF